MPCSKPLFHLDVADFDGGVCLPVAARNLVLAARLVLHHQVLYSAALLDDLSGHFGLCGLRAVDELFVVVVDSEHFVESDFAPDLAFQLLDPDGLTRGDAVLLASSCESRRTYSLLKHVRIHNYTGLDASSSTQSRTVGLNCRGRF